MNNDGTRRLNCNSCGTPFTCQLGQSNCWCNEVEVDAEVRAKLPESFDDCLCKSCLEKASELVAE